MSDYKSTLNLPETSFPMKANLAQNEPETLAFWQKIDAYAAMVEANKNAAAYVLHDGPPYANGHIHLGTALNKILKDITVKSRNMQGLRAEYVPGWDCHGLPIELKVTQDLGAKKKDLPATVIRKLCREYANKFVDIQRKEFKRLGVLGVWDDPYITMAPAYESATAKELIKFMRSGSLVRSKKPIYWCISCQTALAEAEVEYADHNSHSIFIRFPLRDQAAQKVLPEADLNNTYIVIWTTTPWTIPSNLAVMVHPEYDYVLLKQDGDFYILAEALLDECRQKLNLTDAQVLRTLKGRELERLMATHPIYNRDSIIILSEAVTLDAGTGCVHCAPGHGPDDFLAGLRYGLEAYSPLDNQGRFLDDVEFFAGLDVFSANPKVVEKLEEKGTLLAQGKIGHSYPHCWRCKNPVIFRATTQWFISMQHNELRQKALKAIRNDVKWIPAWGEDRIYNMIESRPDWCVSRQRTWGVPILALICDGCNEAWSDPDWADQIADKFATHPTGCDYWFETPVAELAPANLACPHCGKKQWRKDIDILDVWFDSGTSFAAVVEKRKECSFPADLYLEGSDQHRGWFHSSLLVSIANRGVPPYKSVLTHGYVVDGQGKKMSKSLGNVIAPQEIIEKYGAEILRMWVSSVEYREDIRISEEIISRLVDAYRRLRNTCRYLLGNLSDFKHSYALPEEELDDLDRYALHLAAEAHKKIQEGYANFEFHKVFHTLHNFCSTDLSSFYLDIIKDRLYVSGTNSKARRSAQTAMHCILRQLIADMAPVLSFTAEEALRHLPEGIKEDVPTVFALRLDDKAALNLPEKDLAVWKTLQLIREETTSAIEPVRKAGVVGHSLDTHVTLYLSDDVLSQLQSLKTDLRSLFIVSKLSLAPIAQATQDAVKSDKMENLAILVKRAPGEKCERCWVYSDELGSDTAHPTICPRCTKVLQES